MGIRMRAPCAFEFEVGGGLDHIQLHLISKIVLSDSYTPYVTDLREGVKT